MKKERDNRLLRECFLVLEGEQGITHHVAAALRLLHMGGFCER